MTTIGIDPGGLGFRIETIWAFLAVHGDGDEGVVGAMMGSAMVPLIAADEERLESLRQVAVDIARVFGKPIVLAKFTVREDIEEIKT